MVQSRLIPDTQDRARRPDMQKVPDIIDAWEEDMSLSHRSVGITAAFVAAILGAGCWSAPASAQSAADFYRGQKLLTIYVSSSAGGGYDAYARMITRYMSRYLPGNPTFAVNNMPGAGGVTAANYIYNIAPHDGTVIAAIDRSIPTSALFFGTASAAKFDATKFSWIGSAQRDVGLGFVSAKSPAQTMEQAKQVETTIGAPGVESDSATFARLFNELIGTKFKVIAGYPGLTEVDLALEKGEVDGVFMTGWGGATTNNALDLAHAKKGSILVQLALQPKAEMAQAPLITDLVSSPEDKEVVSLIVSRMDLGRPFVGPPGIPADRLAMLQDAFMKACADPQLVEEANRTKAPVNPIGGVEAQQMVAQLYRTPQPIVDRIRKITGFAK
jgi:tripartite-type tricarboxylate transporter receptor subunit TctC